MSHSVLQDPPFELMPGGPSTVAMHKGIWRLSSRLSLASVGSEGKNSETTMVNSVTEKGHMHP